MQRRASFSSPVPPKDKTCLASAESIDPKRDRLVESHLSKIRARMSSDSLGISANRGIAGGRSLDSLARGGAAAMSRHFLYKKMTAV